MFALPTSTSTWRVRGLLRLMSFRSFLRPVSALALAGSLFTISSASQAADSDLRISSIGYHPDQAKVASSLLSSSQFEVRRVSDDSVALAGMTAPGDARSNPVVPTEFAYVIDFSSLTEEGDYYLWVEDVGRSIDFTIGKTVYDEGLVLAMLGMYGWRANVNVSLMHQGQTFSHAAGHMNDGLLDEVGQAGVTKDGLGGWYDAGDYGKYSSNGAFALGLMLKAWEHFSGNLSQVVLPIPETGGTFPDYLDEMKVELDWLLKMQIDGGENVGAFYHKLTPLSFSGFRMPADDSSSRYFAPHGSTATASVAAVLAQASRIFASYAPTYAASLLAAAESAYSWLASNPDYLEADLDAFKTGAYQSDDADERLWAAAELWETTGEAKYLSDLETRLNGMSDPIAQNFNWPDMGNLGGFTYLLSGRSGRDTATVTKMEGALKERADIASSVSERDLFGRAESNYYWGSNGTTVSACSLLHVASVVHASEAARYNAACVSQIAHVYGRNLYNRSQVTGHGIDPPLNPHDRRSGSDGVALPYPGLLVGGGSTSDNWVDAQGSYETNEVAINWNAGLVYALAGFSEGTLVYDGSEGGTAKAVAGPPPPPARSPTELIDDLEDGDLSILPVQGRNGAWHTSQDETSDAPLLTNVEAGGEGKRGIHGVGGPYTGWGAGMGFTFVEKDGGLESYDATGYEGVSFMVRGGPEAGDNLRLSIRDGNNDPSGGICQDCWDSFQIQLPLTGEWTRHYVRFDELRQQGFGDSFPRLAVDRLYALEFQTMEDDSMDLFIDEVGFVDEDGDVVSAVPGEGGASAGLGGAGHLGGLGGGGEPGENPIGQEDSGCGCRSAGNRSGAPFAGFLGLLVLALGVRRRHGGVAKL